MDENERYVEQLEQALLKEKGISTQMSTAAMNASSFQSIEEKDLMRYQLEIDELLEKIEHLLRGDIAKRDAKGNIIWVSPENEKDWIFNHYGVQRIMSIACMYINKNTMLSNYDELTINKKILDLGNELNDLIFTSYEEMGIESEKETKLYPIIVLSITDMAHSTYLRALNGMENKGLRERIMVTQNLNPNQPIPTYPSHRKRRTLNPLTWI